MKEEELRKRRAVIVDGLKQLDEKLGLFDQTTHVHIPHETDPIADVATCLRLAWLEPGGYNVSNLSQAIQNLERTNRG